MKVKICGLMNHEDALFANIQGAWALGFNFYRHSPRCLTLEAANQIIAKLPSSILKVGVFVNATYEILVHYQQSLGLDLFQVHGPVNAPSTFKQNLILSLQANALDELSTDIDLQSYGYLLLDAPKQKDGLFGGTGRLSNLNLAKNLADNHRLILAGGLNAQNVKMAIETVRPYAVDVASGVECSLAKKDQGLIQHFLEVCHDNA